MKKTLAILCLTAIFAASLFGCAGKGGDSSAASSSSSKSTSSQSKEKTTSSDADAPSESPDKTSETDGKTVLNNYFDKLKKGDSPILGAWTIEEVGGVTVFFRSDGYSELMADSEGYFSSYNYDESSGKINLQVHPSFLTGEFTLKLSDDKKTISLSSGDANFTLKRTDKISVIPQAPTKKTLDKKLFGWWKDENGILYFFGSDGIMYVNSISFETGYTYSAKNGSINAVYVIESPLKEKLSYKFDGKDLILNDTRMTKVESQ